MRMFTAGKNNHLKGHAWERFMLGYITKLVLFKIMTISLVKYW
jgi:hypothetical protein